MSIPFGDLPFAQLDELVSNLFSRVVKINGEIFPSASLMGILNGYNRILRHASDLRSLKGSDYILLRDFNINAHPAFPKTRLVMKAALTNSAKEGANKKCKQVEILIEKHEIAILVDIDHQVSNSHSCQKRLAFYLLVRLGLHGASELWELYRNDIGVLTDKVGKEYVTFEERQSKNNSYTLDRYSEEQFRKVFHSYEADLVLTVKQYKRHLPPEAVTQKPDLFFQAITNPVGIVWYNKVHKVGKETASKWLKNMALLVGLAPDIFSNRSGRATLITRLAAQGVPDEVGMLISEHHTTGGYQRYDRTQKLKMEGATLVSANPQLEYGVALSYVSKKFMAKELVGLSSGLKPLLERVTDKSNVQLAITNLMQVSAEPKGKEKADMHVSVVNSNQESCNPLSNMQLGDLKRKASDSESYFDDFDWENHILARNPMLFKHMSGPPKQRVTVGNSLSGNSFHNCTVMFKIVKPGEEEDDNKNSAVPNQNVL